MLVITVIISELKVLGAPGSPLPEPACFICALLCLCQSLPGRVLRGSWGPGVTEAGFLSSEGETKASRERATMGSQEHLPENQVRLSCRRVGMVGGEGGTEAGS